MSISTLLRILVYAIAVYRFTLLLVEEDGPGHIFTRLRVWAGISTQVVIVGNGDAQEAQAQKIMSEDAGFLAEMLDCPYCMSGWLSVWATIGVWKGWKLFDAIAVWGCIWGIVAYIFKQQDY